MNDTSRSGRNKLILYLAAFSLSRTLRKTGYPMPDLSPDQHPVYDSAS